MPFHRILIWSILIINIAIITDSFLLPPTLHGEIYKFRSSVRTSDGYHQLRSYSTDFLVTQSGHRYQLPDHCWIHRTEDDSITVGLTRLFRRPAIVKWFEGDGCYTVDIRMFSGSYIVLASICATSLFALALLFFPSLLSIPRQERYLGIGIAFSAVTLLCYFL